MNKTKRMTKRERKAIYGVQRINKVGNRAQNGWLKAAEKAGIGIEVGGIAPLGHFQFAYPDKQVLKTLFVQLMLKRGILATNALYVMYAHNDEDVDKYLIEVEEVFHILADAIKKDNIKSMLEGPVAHTGFFRFR